MQVKANPPESKPQTLVIPESSWMSATLHPHSAQPQPHPLPMRAAVSFNIDYLDGESSKVFSTAFDHSNCSAKTGQASVAFSDI